MVFKPFSHLARRTTKSLVHHAQSITAASSTTTGQHFDKYTQHRFAKSENLQHRESFHNSSIQQSLGNKATLSSPGLDGGHDSGLDAYFAAWQRVQHGEEWEQFQFRKRIDWQKTSSTTEKSKATENDLDGSHVLTTRSQPPTRAHSASAVETIKRTQERTEDVEAPTPSQTDVAATQRADEGLKNMGVEGAAPGLIEAEAADAVDIQRSDKGSQLSPIDTLSPTSIGSRQSLETGVSSLGLVDGHPYIAHLLSLERKGDFAEIPALFQILVQEGIVPTVEAYNALILAAIRLPAFSYQVIPKVLDVYSDMMRRKVVPDARTYTLLLESLSVRALEVHESQQALEEQKLRFSSIKSLNKSLFRSHETEAEMLAEDDSLPIALKLFSMATKDGLQQLLTSGTYRILIEACAAHGDVESMIQIHTHMEASKVVPYASIYPAMIQAFATAGELRNAIECYEGYKLMAIADDNGVPSIIHRADDSVYAAVVRGYLSCGKQVGADSFYAKLDNSEVADNIQKLRLRSARSAVVAEGYMSHSLGRLDFDSALRYLQTTSLSQETRDDLLSLICVKAADNNAFEHATLAHSQISNTKSPSVSAALLAMHLRQGDLLAAREIWSNHFWIARPSRDLLEASALYAIALIGGKSVDEGLSEARNAFTRVRAASKGLKDEAEVTELIDEAIEVIGSFMKDCGIVPSGQATMNLMWSMIDNGGLIPSVSEQLLSGLGPNEVNSLSKQDLKLALQVEAGVVGNGKAVPDLAHSARFAHLLDASMVARMPIDNRTSDLVHVALNVIASQRPDLVSQWQTYNSIAPNTAVPASLFHQPTPSHYSSALVNDNFDPYLGTLDHRGSTIIVDELEKQGANPSATLSEALARFRNIRRAGRHPRYIAYAKLITAAAKDGRANLIHDLVGLAQKDMPLVPQHPIVRHGWASILDAMVGACLTTGNRHAAAQYHQQLRDIGCAPTANTFGLYITTLKESTKTFDEASEAVRIFQQAKLEGVEPSSFLYNALIGKLGKARRIDDCLFYFAEMRALQIRPTSVTYGTIVNALCRVSDERFAQELFDEMESMPNYKPRPAPYNSLMQFFLTTKRDSSKVLEYYERMQSRNIQPTMHTYKLLIDTYATLEPMNFAAAEGVFDTIRTAGHSPEAVHYASLIHAKGCVLHDMEGARKVFNTVMQDSRIRPQACLYQALFESMVANHCVKDTDSFLLDMASKSIKVTPYIANTLIHGWALENDISKAQSIYEMIGKENREPSTYEAMTRAFLAAEDRGSAQGVVHEMLSRGYPAAVSGKVLELLGHRSTL